MLFWIFLLSFVSFCYCLHLFAIVCIFLLLFASFCYCLHLFASVEVGWGACGCAGENFDIVKIGEQTAGTLKP
ncbi:hypothetical protein BU25DRAFT_164502 [Macroventuria anomochaeta]|uniref:Uncharacterized protein n=1 Tax=Macroventuria anomochaeta TaxID=301207 RepID=A0ACB6RRA8_9PLEO|nr:uncharacterized protein BU25DRAFT_164502 [Macroventuria anomochaeta]KAF2623935.1 hypothetical protein BU25DRAFT_164502 [Macroventuria anomochaeta]